jgi:hypothetical protein
MSEPDWQQYRIDPNMDGPGPSMIKLLGFMTAFIDWRADIKANAGPVSQPKRKKRKAS